MTIALPQRPATAVAADIIDDAADHLKRVGLYPHGYIDRLQYFMGTPMGRCRKDVYGALSLALVGQPVPGGRLWGIRENEVFTTAQMAIARRLNGRTISSWVADDGRTVDEVIAALRDTATALRGEATS